MKIQITAIPWRITDTRNLKLLAEAVYGDVYVNVIGEQVYVRGEVWNPFTYTQQFSNVFNWVSHIVRASPFGGFQIGHFDTQEDPTVTKMYVGIHYQDRYYGCVWTTSNSLMLVETTLQVAMWAAQKLRDSK